MDAMQVTETLSQGLKHEFQISVPAADLDAKADAKLVDLKDKVRLNGFRPGKVPVTHLKKIYGRSVMAETIDQTIRDTNTQLFTERGFRLAAEPKITMPTEQKEVEELLAGKSDLTYTVAIEVVPPIQLADFKSFAVEKLVAEVTDADVDEAVNRIAEQNRSYVAKGEGAKAESGDRVTVNFKGTIDGTPFDGGTGENIEVVIGSNTFIPGFEDQLIGIAAGETRTVKATFPKNYASTALAGKDAEFETTATVVEAPQPVEVNEEFAKTLGVESLDKLKEALRGRLTAEFAVATRQRVKRALLDRLDETHKFEAPQTLVDEEFNLMWNSIKAEMEFGRQDLRRREHHRGQGEGRIPRHRRSPGPARARAVGDRREEQDHGDRRRGRPRGDRACAFDAGPREGSLGLLPQQRQCAGPASCTDLRRQGGGLHPRACQRDREEGHARGALQGRRGEERSLMRYRAVIQPAGAPSILRTLIFVRRTLMMNRKSGWCAAPSLANRLPPGPPTLLGRFGLNVWSCRREIGPYL